MERSVEVVTGESVVFRYELAGLGSRFLAVAIDVAVQLLVTAAALALLVWLAASLAHGAPVRIATGAGDKVVGAIATAVVIAFAFVLYVGYFIVFEAWWNGRTPGKRALRIRVVREGGFPIGITSAFVRNAVRILEFGLGFYAVSGLVVLASPRNQRLGDMAAGTLVVRESRFARGYAPQLESGADGAEAAGARLPPELRDLVRRYAERRASLRPSARAAVAREIAAGVRGRLDVAFDHLDDDALLEHLARTSLG